jgi:hypothetical protein
VALLRTIGLREIDSPSVFDLKPGEFLRCDDGSILFSNGRGYGGAFLRSISTRPARSPGRSSWVS